MPTRRLIDPRWAAITAAVVAIIVWGSLYPFAFYPRGTLADGLRFLLRTWPEPDDRGDYISNILLYAPLGFFAVRSLRRPGFASRVALVALFGTALSAAMEFTQFWDVGRAPSIADLYSNALGTLAGALVAGLNPRAWNVPLLGKIEWRPFALLLVWFWLGNRLFPYVPAFPWHAPTWKLNLAGFAWVDLYSQTVNWMAFGLLLEALFGLARSRRALALSAALVIAARLLLGVALPIEELGAMLGVALWTLVLSRIPIRAGVVTALFAISVALQALQPFHFDPRPRAFGWIPFTSFIDGPRENGVRVFLDKAFTYGTFVWLAARVGLTWAYAATLCTAFVLGLRLLQVYVPGRSAEVTDAAMLLLLACIMRMMRDVPHRA